jgi:hypothetical protein
MYKNVNIHCIEDDRDQPNDVFGFHGQTQYYRKMLKLNTITDE